MVVEHAEVEQEVTDFLLLATEFSDRPPAAMAYCRLAAECIIHNLHHREFGEFPKPDKKGSYPSLAGTVTRVKDSIERQTSEVLYSINAQSRGSLHWDFEGRGKGAKKYHVEAVISQISNAFNDIYDKELSLTGMKIGDEEIEWGSQGAVGEEFRIRDSNEYPALSEEEGDVTTWAFAGGTASIAENMSTSLKDGTICSITGSGGTVLIGNLGLVGSRGKFTAIITERHLILEGFDGYGIRMDLESISKIRHMKLPDLPGGIPIIGTLAIGVGYSALPPPVGWAVCVAGGISIVSYLSLRSSVLAIEEEDERHFVSGSEGSLMRLCLIVDRIIGGASVRDSILGFDEFTF